MLRVHGKRFAKKPRDSWPPDKPQNRAFISAKSFRVYPATMLEFR